MNGIQTGTVTSADGTLIAVDRSGGRLGRGVRRVVRRGAAPGLAYEARVMGPGNALPGGLLAAITQPALVLNGGASPAWMRRAGQAVADAIPGAVYRVLEGQAHSVAPTAIVPELLEFLVRS